MIDPNAQWQIITGDCLDVMKHIPAGMVGAVVTDPPYGVDWNTDYTRFTSKFNIKLTKHAKVQNDAGPFDPSPWLDFPKVVMFGANCFSRYLPVGSWLVWDKRFQNGTSFLADGEAAWMKGGHGLYIKSVTWQGCIRPETIEHPTQKPVEVMEWCMDKAKIPAGVVVLDPYCGSGTTGVACIRTGRRFIGIELDPKYADIARRRCAEAEPVLFTKADKPEEAKLWA
jgi:DNA modification methylase